MSYITNKLRKITITYSCYIDLIKPKIIIGNILSIIGGFFIAVEEKINFLLLFDTIIGTSLIISANCILNNIIDRNTDALMKRTKNRALVTKSITPQHAFSCAVILFIIGFYILLYKTNLIIIYLLITSSIIYIGIYSILMKKRSIYSTLIGSLSGASPPAIGYCSVKNNFDTGTLILIILFILWQIPHFYSIAIFRFTDYQSASIPTFPIKKGFNKTKQHMIFFIILFMINLLILTLQNHLSYIFLIFMESVSVVWLYTACWKNEQHINNKIIVHWSKKMFILSIIVITCFNVTIFIDSIYRLFF